MAKIQNINFEDKKEIEIMRQHGFIYDEEFHKYVKEGYGAFLTNTNDFSGTADYMSTRITNKFFEYYLNRGFDLVVGPPAPSKNGKIPCKNAIYIKNYKDIRFVGSKMVAVRNTNKKDSINNETAGENTKAVSNAVIDNNTSKELNDCNIITTDEISLIVKNFQRIINEYKMATMHSAFGINVIDIAINQLYSYEKEILNKYKNKNLYKILCILKNDLIEYDKCKVHIIYTLENGLLDNMFNQKVSSPEVDKFVAQGFRIINNYSTVQKHSMLGINVNDANNVAIDEIYNFIEMVNELSLDERCTILYEIDKYFADKDSQLPDSAVKIINEIRNKIFEEKFGDKQKDKSKIKK